MHLYLSTAEAQAESAEIHEFNGNLWPGWTSRVALPSAFHPKVMGASHSSIYLVDGLGKTVVYPLNSLPRTKADDNPKLLSDLTKLRDAIKLAGHKGSVSIELVVETNGTPSAIQIGGPATLSNHPDVIAAVQSLRFRPKIQAGSAVAVPMTLELAADLRSHK